MFNPQPVFMDLSKPYKVIEGNIYPKDSSGATELGPSIAQYGIMYQGNFRDIIPQVIQSLQEIQKEELNRCPECDSPHPKMRCWAWVDDEKDGIHKCEHLRHTTSLERG